MAFFVGGDPGRGRACKASARRFESFHPHQENNDGDNKAKGEIETRRLDFCLRNSTGEYRPFKPSVAGSSPAGGTQRQIWGVV